MTRLPPPPEQVTHIMLADLLRRCCNAQQWFWCHIPNGGKRDKITGALLERMGVKPGIYDFMFINNQGRVHFLELKRLTDLSPAQCAFRDLMRSFDVDASCAREFEDAVAILVDWGVLPNVRVAGVRDERGNITAAKDAE